VVKQFIQVAEGLHALHHLRHVHCDLKPNNILINAEGAVKVIDLGQACPVGTVKKRIQGTPDFIAPEQVKCEPVSVRTDIYNFGATMYWALTRKMMPTLFTIKKGENSFLMDTQVPSPRDLNPSVPETLSNLVMECIRTNVSKRPPDMKELAFRLDVIGSTAFRGARVPATTGTTGTVAVGAPAGAAPIAPPVGAQLSAAQVPAVTPSPATPTAPDRVPAAARVAAPAPVVGPAHLTAAVPLNPAAPPAAAVITPAAAVTTPAAATPDATVILHIQNEPDANDSAGPAPAAARWNPNRLDAPKADAGSANAETVILSYNDLADEIAVDRLSADPRDIDPAKRDGPRDQPRIEPERIDPRYVDRQRIADDDDEISLGMDTAPAEDDEIIPLREEIDDIQPKRRRDTVMDDSRGPQPVG
jgi:hypothetical protein